jgi:mannosylglucosylglycerate synthase
VKLAFVHYAYAPVIGGVESVMLQHAQLCARAGYEVTVIAGSGSSADPRVEFVRLAELDPHHEWVERAQAEAAGGVEAGGAFASLKDWIVGRMREIIVAREIDLIVSHNMWTMHFNLAATAALWELFLEPMMPYQINWVHDLTLENPDYVVPQGAYPWDLMAKVPVGLPCVTISKRRRDQLCQRMGLAVDDVPVISNGLESRSLLQLSPEVMQLTSELGLLQRDVVMIHPTRILRRKNIECGLRVLRSLLDLGRDAVYLVTGAPDPHNAAARAYGDELRGLAEQLELARHFFFISERFEVDDRDLFSLYSISDLLFLPSRQEGFGLPLLEAGMFRMPVFCPALEPMRSVLHHNVTLFGLDDPPRDIALRVMDVLSRDQGSLARKEVVRNYSWGEIFHSQMRPLFERVVRSPVA